MPGTIKSSVSFVTAADFPLPASFPQLKVALEASGSISRHSREPGTVKVIDFLR